MKLLVIGSGGREHAIAKTLLESPLVEVVYCAKGNARMVLDGIQVVDIDETDAASLVAFAQEQEIAWTFIGPEIPLFHGVSDAFYEAGLQVFAPSKAAAKIEYSKDFAKQLMHKYKIPTATSATFTDFQEAKAYVEKVRLPIVIKADGLAAGKGVVVAFDMDEAVEALSSMLIDESYKGSNQEAVVLVEEFLEGEEISIFAFVDEDKAYFAGISQDHKRAYTNDLGPNTGGMGAYSPVPHYGQEIIDETMNRVVQPLIKGLIEEGSPYHGVLYVGLMVTKEGIKVIEFNARFGDPETQVVLQRLDSDLAKIISDILSGYKPTIKWKSHGVSLGVVVAAEGYPNSYESGFSLGTLQVPNDSQLQLFAAGVTKGNDDSHFNAKGGRLFLVSSDGDTMEEAQQRVYSYLQATAIPHTFYRTDIGNKALQAKS